MMRNQVSLHQVQSILVDIEGTTTDIRFVHNTLFPYARTEMRQFIETNASRADVVRELAQVAHESGCDGTDLGCLINALIRWIDEDQKITPLKSLQGLIWETGFKQNHFKSHMYDDAVAQLKFWHATGLQLNVFSSGSVFAQKLLFGYTEAGDLTPLFTHYFDTNIGSKKERESYLNIIQELACSADRILFLSDVVAELDAAQEAGIQTIQLVRSENMETSSHPTVASFEQINLTNP